MPCSSEAPHSASLCFLAEETDLLLTPGTGTAVMEVAAGGRVLYLITSVYLLFFSDRSPGSFRPGRGDRHGAGYRQSGSEQHRLTPSAQHLCCWRSGLRSLLRV